MAENIDFQFPMKQACSADIKRYCKDVQHGHAKIIRCLEENMEQPAFNATCKAQVEKHAANAATDYRRAPPLSKPTSPNPQPTSPETQARTRCARPTAPHLSPVAGVAT
jgi:hypothetical protein